jgi:hypothetical protein
LTLIQARQRVWADRIGEKVGEDVLKRTIKSVGQILEALSNEG